MDDVIEEIGGFGKFQLRLLLLLGYTTICNGALNLQQVMAPSTSSKCCPRAGLSLSAFLSLARPPARSPPETISTPAPSTSRRCFSRPGPVLCCCCWSSS